MSIFTKRILSNSVWMIFEKVVGIFGLILVTSYVAKYIGPTNFGKITLATTLFTFVQTFTWFGNQEILFKRVSRNSKSGLQYLHATQHIRQVIFLLSSIPVLIWFYYYTDTLSFIFGLATAMASYFLVQDIYNIYNNALLQSSINALSNVIGLGIALTIRYIIVMLQLDITFLAIPIVLVSLLPFMLKRYIFNRQQAQDICKTDKYNKYYLLAGSALVISTLSISLYTQVTNIFLVSLTNTYNLGIYSVAVTLGMSWGFINQAVITSVLSGIYRQKDDYRAYQMTAKLNAFIIAISLLVIVSLVLFGPWLINVLYGSAYQKAHSLVTIVAFATLFSGLGTVSARIMIREQGYTYISKKMMLVALSSIPIAYSCIYYAGLNGAAYSVLLIELLSCTVFNYFYKDGLIFKIHFFPLFKQQLQAKYNIGATGV